MEALKQELKGKIIEVLNLEDINIEDVNDNDALFGDGLGLDSIEVHTDHEESTMSAEMLARIIEDMKKENIKIIIDYRAYNLIQF